MPKMVLLPRITMALGVILEKLHFLMMIRT